MWIRVATISCILILNFSVGSAASESTPPGDVESQSKVTSPTETSTPLSRPSPEVRNEAVNQVKKDQATHAPPPSTGRRPAPYRGHSNQSVYEQQHSTDTSEDEPIQRLLTKREMVLSILALIFGTSILLINLQLVRRMPGEAASFDNLLSLNSVILVITATLFLITAGYTERQIAPAMGLLGTIVGYILGRKTRSGRSTQGETSASPGAEQSH